MKPMSRMFVVVMMLMMIGSAVYAIDETTQAPMDPAMAAKMAQMKVLTSPSEAHKALEAFVGKWTYAGKFWMTPEAPAQDMTGTTENELIFGGRFLILPKGKMPSKATEVEL